MGDDLTSLMFQCSICILFVDVALAPNNNEVQIHQFAAGKWKQLETLSEHGQRVTGIDWAPTSNYIVTCGAVSQSTCSTAVGWSRTFRRHRLCATVSALTVSALGLLGTGTFRHRPLRLWTFRHPASAAAATLHSDTNNTSSSQRNQYLSFRR